ncbi:hypothetical protein [Cupriavidus sp. YAF13]|uniref:hypothetical protein n=1 Tax=Cupriavidus sp. YAF13 TaxID=3233075 RepID=UPI003F8D9352
MEFHNLNGLKALTDYGANFEAAVTQLMALFPSVANAFAWKDAIYSAQSRYRSEQPQQADLQLYVARRWIQLAESNCLDVSSDPANGLTVREVLGSDPHQPQPAGNATMRKRIAKLLFNKLNALPDGRLLQIYEFTAAFRNATGESLASHQSDFNAVVEDLCAKLHMRHQRAGRHGMDLLCKGIEFDSWAEEMAGGSRAAAGDTFNFHSAVGAVQTGSHSVAHVQQTIGSDQLASLKSALQAALIEFAKANIPAQTRDEAQGLIESTIAEVDKPKPNRLALGSLLGGVATAVQTLGATSDAYKAVKEALSTFGISLP